MFLRLFPFVLGLTIGLFIVYVLKPAPVVVVRYPNIDNVGKVVYRDRNGTCFKYEMNEVSCDDVEDRIKDYPLQ
jgi:hypothetical protein